MSVLKKRQRIPVFMVVNPTLGLQMVVVHGNVMYVSNLYF